MSELSRLQQRDPQLGFLDELIRLAQATIDPLRIILFGSRARGDQHSRSDVDLAFDLDPADSAAWGQFTAAAREDLHTLLDLDLVDLRQADAKLAARIVREGVVIYEHGT